jgi:hypothetical protein
MMRQTPEGAVGGQFEESISRNLGTKRWEDLIAPVERAVEAHAAGLADVHDETLLRAAGRLAAAVDRAGEQASPVALVALWHELTGEAAASDEAVEVLREAIAALERRSELPDGP